MVYYYHKLIGNKNLDNVCTECKKGARGCVGCKKELINEMVNFLKPIQERRKYYEDHPEEVEQILKDSHIEKYKMLRFCDKKDKTEYKFLEG